MENASQKTQFLVFLLLLPSSLFSRARTHVEQRNYHALSVRLEGLLPGIVAEPTAIGDEDDGEREAPRCRRPSSAVGIDASFFFFSSSFYLFLPPRRRSPRPPLRRRGRARVLGAGRQGAGERVSLYQKKLDLLIDLRRRLRRRSYFCSPLLDLLLLLLIQKQHP